MEDKKITIIFNSDEKIELSNNTPDLKSLVDKIVELKDVIVIDDIKVKCVKEFDVENFASIIKTSITEFISKININNEDFEKAIDNLNKQKK